MIELIPFTDFKEIQDYIEKKENIKLKLKNKVLNFSKKEGHKPHYDTGDKNQLLWCRYSASTLLSKNYDGGDFVFLDENDNELRTISKDEHYMKTLIFDVNNKHMVKPHYNGDRIVNLYFWESCKTIELSEPVKNYIEKNEQNKKNDI